MADLFYRNPRLLVLTICLILVAGLSSYSVLPRMEDPLTTERAANVNTLFPGADAERVESLVTDKLEEAIEVAEAATESYTDAIAQMRAYDDELNALKVKVFSEEDQISAIEALIEEQFKGRERLRVRALDAGS